MYGAQTCGKVKFYFEKFENDVEMYGAQTSDTFGNVYLLFENDVEMYGAQTTELWQQYRRSLRMM